MSYKTIIVNLNSADSAESVLKVAVQMAERHDAHLLGTFIVQPVIPIVGIYGGIGMTAEIGQTVNTHHQEQATQLKTIFESATASQSFVSEWRYVGDSLIDANRTLLSMGRRADLLFVGGVYKQDDKVQSSDHDKLATIVSGSACPVIVVPNNFQDGSPGEHVLLAYDGKRESSRAIFDALPLLITAKNVWLHCVESPGVDTQHIDDGVRDLADALSRHGVDVEVGLSRAHARDTGKQLLSVAADHGADCMIMGAPAHSRLRDVFLGSAVRYALDNSTLPILFSA